MKKKIITITFLIILPLITSAYTLLEPLPGVECGNPNFTGPCQQGITLAVYLKWLFNFALAAAAFFAVLYIVIGGIRISLGGASESEVKGGHQMISNALWGLLLAISSWLILYTINPGFVTTSLDIKQINLESIKKTQQTTTEEATPAASSPPSTTTPSTVSQPTPSTPTSATPAESSPPAEKETSIQDLKREACEKLTSEDEGACNSIAECLWTDFGCLWMGDF